MKRPNNMSRWLILFGLALLALIIPALGFVYLLVFPFLRIFTVNRRNVLLVAPLLFAVNALASIVNAVLLDTFNLPVTLSSVIILATLEAMILLRTRPKRIDLKVLPDQRKYLYAIYLLFTLAVISRVLSVAHLEAPILHDPQAHAFWANKILKEQSIDYFYSPGLHIWSAFASQAWDMSIARSVHLITNFFSAFSVLAWAIAAYVYTKRGSIAAWTGLMVLIVPLPQFLYFMAGKNSFIMSVPFIALTAVFCLSYQKQRSLINALILLICLVGVGLIHYPAYAYAAGFVLFYQVITYVTDNWPVLPKISIHFLKLFALMLPVIISLGLIALNVFITSAENIKVHTVTSRNEAKLYHEKSKDSDIAVPLYEVTGKKPATQKPIRSPLSAVHDFKNDYLAFIKSIPKDIGVLVFGACLIGLYFLIASKPNMSEEAHYKTLVISFMAAAFLIVLAWNIYPVSSLSTTKDTGLLLSLLFLSLPLAWLLASVSRKKYIEYSVILAIAFVFSYFTFTTFRIKSSAPVVDKHDVQAFAWIDDNLSDHEKFIGLSSLDPVRKSIVFPIDGALWLPVFTGNQTATPFQEMGFVAVRSHVNYEYVRRLRSEDKAQVANAVRFFVDNEYRYIYVDGEAAYKELGIPYLIEHRLAELAYQNESISIYQLSIQ